MDISDDSMYLERVFIAIGSANTDDELENSLKKYLPRVIPKLSSDQDGVRKKVMELLVHINKRLKSRPLVQLPMSTLIACYTDPGATSFVLNFTIIYLKLGYRRLDKEFQAEFTPVLLKCLHGKPLAHQDSILMMLAPAMKYVKFPTDPVQKRQLLSGVLSNPAILSYFLDYMLDMLLLPYGVTALTKPSTGGASSSPLPPGFSEYSFKRVTGEYPLDAAALEETKYGILKLLCCGAFSDASIMPHLVVGSSDTRHSIANFAEMELRRIASDKDWNNNVLASKLYSIFLGTTFNAKSQKTNVKLEYTRQPANTRIRLKILPQLLKSRESAIQFPACIQVIFGCLFGEFAYSSNTKLKLMSVQFVHHICDYCLDEKFSPVAGILLSAMIQLIDKNDEPKKVREMAFIAIGKIGMKAPSLVTSDMVIVQRLFTVLTEEEPEMKMAAQQVLSMLMKPLSSLNAANKKVMEGLIMTNIEKPEYRVRLASMQCAAAVFPDDHIPSRYCLLLASGDSKEDIAAEALGALQLQHTREKKRDLKSQILLPQFKEVMEFISSKAEDRMKSQMRFYIGSRSIPFSPVTYVNMLSYLRLCLVKSAGVNIVDPDDISEKIPLVGKYVQLKMVEADSSSSHFIMYLNLVTKLLEVTKDETSMKYLLEGFAMAPGVMVKSYPIDFDMLKSCMCSTKEAMRESAAELAACIAMHSFSEEKLKDLIEELVSNIKNKSFEAQHGSILTLGFLIGKILRLNRSENLHNNSTLLETAVQEIVKLLDNSSNVIVNACCASLGEMARNGPLPQPDGDPTSSSEITKLSMIKKLSEMLQSSKVVAKTKEKIALALGLMCVGDVNFKYAQLVTEGLLGSSKEAVDIDIHFSVGEALSCVALKQASPLGRDPWTQMEDEYESLFSNMTVDQQALGGILDEILSKHVIHTKLSIRQASCVWLLILLNKCKNHEAMTNRLLKIQNAMVNLLGDRSDVIQEFASKALSVLYEYGDENQKQSLVTVLVETLTKGRKSVQQVSGETEVFHQGSIGTDVSGGSISTYKDLCSLATDLNQPDLVYKFMHLANHNAIWNSKKGAAFGFQSIALQAGDKLTNHLPKIIPKLYRYTFDPNPKARLSFSSIWNSLVQESTKTIDMYFNEIMADVIENLTNNQWRVREACCAAVSDLLRGRNGDQLIEHLPLLWETCFRVRDDIKESVRNAAASTLKTLKKVSVKLCDADGGNKKAISLILPCLIKLGLSSPVQEVRAFSLGTITELSRKAGKLLHPHIPLLFVALLESLSTEESSALNMLSVRLASSQDSQLQLDSLRIASSKSSPMMDTINYCIQYVDMEVLPDLVARLIDLIKNSVGLATKAGSAHVVVSLIHHCPQNMTAFSGKIMAALFNGLTDRNAAVRSCFATTLGNLVKCAKDSSIEKLLTKLEEWYIDKDDKSLQESCGMVIQSMLRYSPDVTKSYSAHVLPLAFFAMHAKSDEGDKKNLWEDVWIEMTPGTEAGLKLYLPEILKICQRGLDSQSWCLKSQSGLAITTVATKLGSNLSPEYFNQTMKILVGCLSGRTWTGKETLLQAIKALSVNCRGAWTNSEITQLSKSEVIESLLKECSKENLSYKIEALEATSEVLNSLEIDHFEAMYLIIKPILAESKNRSDDEDEDKLKFSKWELSLYKALEKSWPDTKFTQEKYTEEYCKLLNSKIQVSTWKCQIAILSCLNTFLKKWKLLNENVNACADIINMIAEKACYCLTDMKYSAVESEAMAVITTLVQKLNKDNVPLNQRIDVATFEKMMISLEALRNHNQPELKSKAKELLTTITRSNM